VLRDCVIKTKRFKYRYCFSNKQYQKVLVFEIYIGLGICNTFSRCWYWYCEYFL